MSVLPVGIGSSGTYSIANSLRLRASASASLSFTPGVAGDRKKLVRRFRIKRGALGSLQVIHSAGTASIDRFYFDSSDRLCLDVLGTARLVTTQVFRDPSAWYVDVGFFLDVANGTASARAGILIDGVEVSSYSTDGRASITNTDTNWNNTAVQYIGRDNAGNYFDGLISEPLGANGTISVSSYSTTNSDNVRVPTIPSATYGTAGWLLKFDNGTSTTTLGYDQSGNGNNWTLNNVSLTSGATYDWMTDTPTNNYATLNPLLAQTASSSSQSEANLTLTTSLTGSEVYAISTNPIPTTGKWYCELTLSSGSWTFSATEFGLVSGPRDIGNNSGRSDQCPSSTVMRGDGQKVVDGAASAYGSAWAGTNVIGMAVNKDSATVEFFINNASQGVISSLDTQDVFISFCLRASSGSVAGYINFGQRPFAYTPPTGFEALCTANRPSGGSITTSGSFTGNASADGPFVWLNGNPETMTINGNAVTWGTHADKTAGGFKVRSSSASYNASGSNTFSVSVTGKLFGDITHAPNTAKGNP